MSPESLSPWITACAGGLRHPGRAWGVDRPMIRRQRLLAAQLAREG
jgi:hypothetical protein